MLILVLAACITLLKEAMKLVCLRIMINYFLQSVVLTGFVFFSQLHPTLFFHGDIRDARKYDTFRRKQADLFINLLGKGLTQEINGDGGSI